MKKKYVIRTVFALGATILLGTAGILYSNYAESEPPKEQKTYSINSKTDRAIDYETIDKLVSDAQIIVRGSVVETDAICDSDGLVQTRFTFQVSESYKGSYQKNDKVNMLAAGGIIDVEEYAANVDDWLSAPDGITQIEYTFDEAPLIKDGQEYIIFADSFEYTDGNTYYYPIGNYQGQFAITQEGIQRYVPNDFNEEITEHNTHEFIDEVMTAS